MLTENQKVSIMSGILTIVISAAVFGVVTRDEPIRLFSLIQNDREVILIGDSSLTVNDISQGATIIGMSAALAYGISLGTAKKIFKARTAH